ncbi:MAG: transketolase C-terminal domain-containing protein [bacterium]|nr:transketolase C-terminal domain-containing protein [bacterium]
MIIENQKLSRKLFADDIELVPNRKGFGEGLVEAGKNDERVVALCADLTESTQMEAFKKEFPNRFIEVGVAEQNLATVASGMAAVNKIPFITSYAGFSPGRNWEQIRTTITLNEREVKIIGSHGGVSVGPDGATHQMLEDIAMMRSMPNMIVVVPCDYFEAKKATIAIAKNSRPTYLRLAREKTAVITTLDSPFEIGKAQVLFSGSDLTIVACGPLVYEALKAAKNLSKQNISAEVINSSTIKPLDKDTILKSAKKTQAVLTVEEAQINGGLGSAIAEVLSENHPTALIRIGARDRFGQSGKITELWEEYELNAKHIEKFAIELIKRKG